jgi:hypothetical protein
MARIKKCKQCKNSFEVLRPLQYLCGPVCATKYVGKKESEKRLKQMKRDLKDHQFYIQTLQKIFNTWIRLRDQGKDCISCGKKLTGTYHAGHFIPTTKQALRFNEDNVFGQCIKCNLHLHGNINGYVRNLPKRIGWERMERLYELEHTTVKWTIEELKELINIYKLRIKEINDKAI